MPPFSGVFIKDRHSFNANLGQWLITACAITMEMTGWGFPGIFFSEIKSGFEVGYLEVEMSS